MMRWQTLPFGDAASEIAGLGGASAAPATAVETMALVHGAFVPGASHLVFLSHPDAGAAVIEEAAK